MFEIISVYLVSGLIVAVSGFDTAAWSCLGGVTVLTSEFKVRLASASL